MKSINNPHHQNAHSTIIAVGILTIQKTSFRKITLFIKEKGTRWLLGILKNSSFVDENYTLFSLFDDYETIEKEEKLQKAIDSDREKFGFLAIQKGTVLTDGSRNIERSKLIGGHSAGGLDGLK